jgi:hypothetical protein
MKKSSPNSIISFGHSDKLSLPEENEEDEDTDDTTARSFTDNHISKVSSTRRARNVIHNLWFRSEGCEPVEFEKGMKRHFLVSRKRRETVKRPGRWI